VAALVSNGDQRSVHDLAKVYATRTRNPIPTANGSPTKGPVVIPAILGPIVINIAEPRRRVPDHDVPLQRAKLQSDAGANCQDANPTIS
jgi:hypothetical protein